jgi:hypothetical protein
VPVEPGLVSDREIASEARFARVFEFVADDAVQPVRPHRPLPAGQVAQQAAQGLVALGNQVFVGALEGHAVESPDSQVVAAAGHHVVRADQRRERHETRERVLSSCLLPIPGRRSGPARCGRCRGAVRFRP